MMIEKISNFDWSQPKEVQVVVKEAIRLKIGSNIFPLLMQNLRKAQWESAAEVLESL
jgi:hypothetical protein